MDEAPFVLIQKTGFQEPTVESRPDWERAVDDAFRAAGEWVRAAARGELVVARRWASGALEPLVAVQVSRRREPLGMTGEKRPARGRFSRRFTAGSGLTAASAGKRVVGFRPEAKD